MSLPGETNGVKGTVKIVGTATFRFCSALAEVFGDDGYVSPAYLPLPMMCIESDLLCGQELEKASCGFGMKLDRPHRAGLSVVVGERDGTIVEDFDDRTAAISATHRLLVNQLGHRSILQPVATETS
jgi:hypothetical protein